MNIIEYLSTTNNPITTQSEETSTRRNPNLDVRFNPVAVELPSDFTGYTPVFKPKPRPQGFTYAYTESDSTEEPTNTNKSEFISGMTTAYEKALINAGLSTKYAKYLVAQDALESNYGKSHAGKYNYGNITVGSNRNASYTEGSDTDGNGNPITQKFRNYDSVDDYAANKVALLKGSRYKAFSGDPDSVEDFYTRIKSGGYATDPDYVSKLVKVYKSLS